MNERQYGITHRQASKFELAINEFDRESLRRQRVDSRMLDAEREALMSQLESLKRELSEYDRLKSDDASLALADSLKN